MHPTELSAFYDDVAAPRMQQLFEKTQIPEGVCYIDQLEIYSLDGRSCGYDSRICAYGLTYHNGNAERYAYDICDVSLQEFFAEHASCIFVSDGVLKIGDDLGEMFLHTVIRNISVAPRLFPWLESPADLTMEMHSAAYEKLCLLYAAAEKSAPSLADQISAASLRAGAGRTPQEQPDMDRDDCF